MDDAANGNMMAAVAVLDRNADIGIATTIKTAINVFSLVPTREIIDLPIRGAAPVSNSALPTVIMPAIKKTMSFPNPANAVVKGITPNIAIAKQAKMDVVASGMNSNMNRIIMMPMMARAIVLGSTSVTPVVKN